MNCQDAREHLEASIRGILAAEDAEALRVHLAACPACREALELQRAIRARIRAEAPRYAAPPQLRARIRDQILAPAGRPAPPPPVRRPWAWRPRRAAAALAGALVLAAAIWGPSLWTARDPVGRLVTRALAEHEEYAREAAPRPPADPAALMGSVGSQAGFALDSVFAGDGEVRLVHALPTELPGTRAVAFVYRDAADRYATLFLMPGAGVVVPEQDRLPIESFRPHHRAAAGRQLFLWKTRELAYLLVTEGSQADGAALFLKIRRAT
jgi:anti-sigma factor (TIGR02949 family)